MKYNQTTMTSPVSSAVYFDNRDSYSVNNSKVNKEQSSDAREHATQELLENGVHYYSTGDNYKALKSFNSALNAQILIYGRNHPCVSQTISNIGCAHLKNGDLDKAAETLKEALRMKLQTMRGNSLVDPGITSVLSNLGCVCLMKGLHDEAINYYQSALDNQKEVATKNGSNVIYIIDILYNMGRAHIAKGNFDKAMSIFSESLYFARSKYGKDHLETADTLEKIGAIYLHKGMFNEAMQAFEEVLRVTQFILGSNHPDVAPSFYNIGMVYQRRGELSIAKEMYSKALEIYKTNGYKNEDRCVISVRTNISTVERLMSTSR